jgi:hypothetical protein
MCQLLSYTILFSQKKKRHVAHRRDLAWYKIFTGLNRDIIRSSLPGRAVSGAPFNLTDSLRRRSARRNLIVTAAAHPCVPFESGWQRSRPRPDPRHLFPVPAPISSKYCLRPRTRRILEIRRGPWGFM